MVPLQKTEILLLEEYYYIQRKKWQIEFLSVSNESLTEKTELRFPGKETVFCSILMRQSIISVDWESELITKSKEWKSKAKAEGIEMCYPRRLEWHLPSLDMGSHVCMT